MIFVLSDRGRIEAQIHEAVGHLVAVQTIPLSTGSSADADGLSVVIIDGSDDVDAALDLAAEFDLGRPGITVVLHAAESPDVLDRAMRVGARDVFGPDADDDRVREVVKRSMELADRRWTTGSESGEKLNRLIVVVSPKGGAGKTTIATNLAVGLAQRAPNQVVLADADLQFGDVGNALRLDPETIDEAEALKPHLAAHRSGLMALCAPDTPIVADEIRPQAYAKVVQLLTEEFRFVVVDTDPGIGERTLSIMDQATDVVFVVATDVASVRGLHKTIDALDRIGLTEAKRHFVLNRADAKVGLDLDEIAAAVGARADVLVPSDVSMPISMNAGVPILDETDGPSDSPAAAPLWRLVDRFLLKDANQDEHRGLFKRKH